MENLTIIRQNKYTIFQNYNDIQNRNKLYLNIRIKTAIIYDAIYRTLSTAKMTYSSKNLTMMTLNLRKPAKKKYETQYGQVK